MKPIIIIDGAQGEGGGQILRSALSLAICTGQSFEIKNIRAGRKKPGLMRQHLTCVSAAAEVSSATLEGAAIGSTALKFSPIMAVDSLNTGTFNFAVGSAGSVMLVLQTILMPLLMAKKASEITISGGTHNGMAPPFEFLQRVFLPALRTMGADVEITLLRHGFYPAGGGQIRVNIKPCGTLKPLNLTARGNMLNCYAEAIIAGVPVEVAQRELAIVGDALALPPSALRIRGLSAHEGPGNALLLTIEHEHVSEVMMALGEKGVSSENVAKKLMQAARAYQNSTASVGEYLADQLLLPMALGAGGTFSSVAISEHFRTNVAVIQQFLKRQITVKTLSDSYHEVVIA